MTERMLRLGTRNVPLAANGHVDHRVQVQTESEEGDSDLYLRMHRQTVRVVIPSSPPTRTVL